METHDNLLDILDVPTVDEQFYTAIPVPHEIQIIPNHYKDYVYRQRFFIDEFKTIYERDAYGFIELIGDMGGISGIFIYIGEFIMIFYTSFSYNLKVFKLF